MTVTAAERSPATDLVDRNPAAVFAAELCCEGVCVWLASAPGPDVMVARPDRRLTCGGHRLMTRRLVS